MNDTHRLFRRLRHGIVLVLSCGILLAGASVATPTTPHSSGSKVAPAFVKSDLHGKKVSLASYRGHVVLLNFWATWCAPCLSEMPRFVAWQNTYGSQGLQVIGVSMDDDAASAQKMDQKLQLNYPVVMGDEKLGDLYGGVMGLPITFLIDRSGKIRYRHQGLTDLKQIEGELKSLL